MKTKGLRVEFSSALWLQLFVVTIAGICLVRTVDGTENTVTSPDGETTPADDRTTLSSQSSGENQFNHITNGALPTDKEITVYVLSGEAKRLYYQIHSSRPEIALTITPCESTIEWKLSYLAKKRPYNRERKARLSRRRYKRRHNKFVAKNVLNNAKPMFLTSYTGSDRHTYSNISSPPGLYVLDFNSLGKDVSVKIYVSQYYPYPLLPNEPDIHVVSVRSDEVVISWPPSPSEAIATIDYCVSIGTNKKLADNCLLDTYLKEEESYELDLLPSEAMTSFSYWWVRTVKNMLRQSRLKSMADHSVRVECIGKQTAHTLQRLDNRRHNQYFIDVYARNTVTNSTSMYRTINVTLINTEPIVVSDEQNIVIKLNQTNNFTQILHYKTLGGDEGTDTNVDKLWLFLQTCTGFGPIRMTGTAVTSANPNATASTAINRTLFTQNIFSLKTLEFNVNDGRRKTTIDHKNQSLIVFAISSGANTDRTAVFTLSKRHNRFLYPLLPEDTKLKVMATLTDCRSVTLAWNASPDDKVQYCIYVREANHRHTSSSNVIAPVDNACVDQGLTIGSEANNNDIDSDDTNDSLRKVLCKRYHKSSKRRFNNKIIQSVRGLSSGQTYVFLVMITKYRGKTLAYEQVWATTRPKYQC